MRSAATGGAAAFGGVCEEGGGAGAAGPGGSAGAHSQRAVIAGGFATLGSLRELAVVFGSECVW